VFVEVRIRPRLGEVRVSRVVAAYDPGRVLNHRTAHGQVMGGVTWGIGFALMEHTFVDPNTARVVNPNLCEVVNLLVTVAASSARAAWFEITARVQASTPASRVDLEELQGRGRRGRRCWVSGFHVWRVACESRLVNSCSS
jgi:xanthine dehydrogenase YagR molybdenum-binding subunit